MSTNGYRGTAYRRYEHFVRPDYPRLAASYRRRLDRHLNPRPDWKCLDPACGAGNFLAYFAACGARDSAAGRARAVREHPWYSRFSQLFALLQGREKSIVRAAEVSR